MEKETIALHGGHTPDETTLSRAVPIYQTTSYLFKNAEHGANLFALKELGNIYTRLMNPTTDVLEKRVAMLEGGTAAIATSSGQAAATFAFSALAGSGDEIIASPWLYGGNYSLLKHTLKRFGISARFVEPTDLEGIKAAINEKTKAIFFETLPNPKLKVFDYEAVANIAAENGLPLIVDNTVATPFLLNPKDFGANVIVHSLTKWMGGHGTSVGGVIVDCGNTDWNTTKTSALREPDEAYHGLVFSDTFKDFPPGAGNTALAFKLRLTLLRDMGSAISPFNSFQILTGIETLHLRMERHSENARKLAEHLNSHDSVAWVNYPGLKDTTDAQSYELAKKYYRKGANGEPMCSSVLTFGLKNGFEAGAKFIDSLKLVSHLANIGDAKTLAIHPASTTHEQLSEEELKASGVSPDMIRLSVGLENADDIIKDIDEALSQS